MAIIVKFKNDFIEDQFKKRVNTFLEAGRMDLAEKYISKVKDRYVSKVLDSAHDTSNLEMEDIAEIQ